MVCVAEVEVQAYAVVMLARGFSILMIVMILMLVPISAALAERDPFDPLVDPARTGPAGSAGGATAIPVTAGGTAQTLPKTGYDFMPPLVMALTFVLAGVALLVLERYASSPPAMKTY